MNLNLNITIEKDRMWIIVDRLLLAYPQLVENGCDYKIINTNKDNIIILHFGFHKADKQLLQDFVDDVADTNLLGSIYE